MLNTYQQNTGYHKVMNFLRDVSTNVQDTKATTNTMAHEVEFLRREVQYLSAQLAANASSQIRVSGKFTPRFPLFHAVGDIPKPCS